ncbi:hypothetical protein J437_LFUL008184 [Ladona fulva]|uniref:NADH dehydrogenase [ubiquinone] flavoprotein 3, mitochondrial n=1 Tax=Ladona fulva TaxID=123851 RepID=A0A8K0K7J8_LADFU|nr:hypothetical protein J437_LFUL008184 [Ladona fulva]
MTMRGILKVCHREAFRRAFSSKTGGSAGASSKTTSSPGSSASSKKPSSASSPTVDVPGLSNKVLSVPNAEVGPGASKSSNYKNPEYFSYHKFSFAEAEMEMIKFRIPQPSNRA